MLPLSHRALLPLLLLTMAIVTSRGDDTYATSACRWQPYLCGDVNISYPFYLASDTKAIPDHDGESYCGYPGLAISCNRSSNKAILNLAGDSYAVSSIDYTNLTVSLADADASNGDCPTVDHNVTIPPDVKLALPISAVDYLFFFVNCSFGHPDADDLDPFTTKRSERRLGWDRSSGQCGQCELSGGMCGYGSGGEFLGCLCADGRVEDGGCSKILADSYSLGT
nr:unnamed protein product [Digitaria exilis]